MTIGSFPLEAQELPTFDPTPQPPTPVDQFLAEKAQIEKKNEKFFETTLSFRIEHPKAKSKADLVIGMENGKLKGRIQTNHLRRVPFATYQRVLGILAFTGVSLGFFAWTAGKQGIVAKELIKAASALGVQELQPLALIPRIVTPLATSLGLYFVQRATNSNLYAQFAFIGSTAVCAVLARRLGKGFTKGTYSGNPNCIDTCHLPCQNSRDFVPLEENDVLTTLDIEVEGDIQNAKLEVSKKDGHMYYQLKIGDIAYESIRIGEDDDDDEDDDEDVPAKAPPSRSRKAAVLATAAGATALSTYFLGEGITTAALTTLFSAPAKADLRMMPWLNGYGLLGGTAGILLTVQNLAPEAFIGQLSFIPITIAASKALKELKDCNTGKRPKNPYWFEVPTVLTRFLNKRIGWLPILPQEEENPFDTTRQKVDVDAQLFHDENPEGENIPVEFRIKGGGLKAKYKIAKARKADIQGLAKVKAKKPSKAREAIFLTSFGLGSLASSYFTQQQSPDTTQNGRAETSRQGEGVLTNLMNGTLTAAAKQTGKKINPKLLFAAMALTVAAVNGTEYALISMDKLPLRFSGIVNAIALGIVSKLSKNWIYGKSYFKKKSTTCLSISLQYQ